MRRHEVKMAGSICSSGVCITMVMLFIARSSNATSGGLTYPFAFFNISTSFADQGFIQVFACSISNPPSTVHLRMKYSNLNQFYQTKTDVLYNITEDYHEMTTAGPLQLNAAVVRPYGFVLAADTDTFIYGVKSGSGTTDGFLVPPITKSHNEFYIAGWTVANSDNYVGVIVVAALDDTCVEAFIISQNGSVYTSYRSVYLANAFSFVEIIMGVDEDTSALYINTTRPVTVLSGVSCANVPVGVFYCDHMVEAIPPVSELGTVHVVPPIAGRRAAVGYLVRVMATQISTTVTWTTVDAKSTVGVAFPGVTYDISVPDASVPIIVTCDKPCLVVQYNRGYLAVGSDTAYSDPFTMVITPVDHYVTGSCYATASFSISADVRTDFDNYLAIATTLANKQNILLDGKILPSRSWQNIQGYAVSAVQVSPGYHIVSTIAGSSATFGGWVYGHSLTDLSTSAYGYPIAYQMNGDPVPDLWIEALQTSTANTAQAAIITCQQQNVTTGSALIADSSMRLYQFIQLNGNLSQGVPMSDSCKTLYITNLRSLLLSTFKYINFQICMQTMCPYLNGTGGVVVAAGNPPAGVAPTDLYAGIDTGNLANYITLVSNNSLVTGIRLTIPYVGYFNTTGESYAHCLADIREFLVPFVNWIQLNNNAYTPTAASSLTSISISPQQQQLLNTSQFIAAPPSCPSLSFMAPQFFYTSPYFCN